MNYTFRLKDNSTLRVFYNDLFKDVENKTHGTVSWFEHFENGEHREIVRTVRIGEDERRFFTWNKEKIYLDEFLAYTPDKLVERLHDVKARVIDEDLCHTLLRYGMDSVRVKRRVKPLEGFDFGGLRLTFEVMSSLDKPEDKDWVNYRFVEEYLHTPDSCYKLKLAPLEAEHVGVYPSRDYYVSDLVSLIGKCKDEFDVYVGNYNNNIKHFMYNPGEF